MKTLLFTTLALVISSFFLAPAVSEAKVLYEHSKVGTPYDLFTDLDGNRTGYLNRAPQYQGEPPFTFDGGGTAYEGTAEWFRVKRLSGLSCDTRFNININATDGTPIGDSRPRGGNTSGEYCDFPIFGPDRTNQSVGRISICVENDCDGIPPFILDGSPSNPGYVFNGAITIFEPGGWAFQICDIEGCSGGFGESSTTTATTTATTTPPTATSTGASSVLFLPGIQASRLYMMDDGSENQIWEPNINSDVEKLSMTESGESINNIYTKDIIDELVFPKVGTNIYKGFMDFMNELVSTNVIKDWDSFPYDWRFDVNDIATGDVNYKNEVKNLVEEIERLSEDSFTEKVTIIGHSNGGLVGKMIISELDRLGKAHLVDKLIMIGTPQLGAPKAALVMLHGYDQKAVFGLVINDSTARDVIKNMPGTYSLLPSSEYYSKSNETLVTTDGTITTASVGAYGLINSVSSMNNFLTDSLNLRNDTVPINEPGTLNSNLLQNSALTKQKLDNWMPPENVEVYEVVGTGNPTIKAVQYQAFPCLFGTLTCETGSYMKAVPVFTDKGDETVPVVSAAGQDGGKVTGYIDLIAESPNILVRPYKHANLTESPAVQEFVTSIIKFPYLEETLVVPDYTNVTRNFKVIGVHSPVSIMLTDSTGKQVGKIGDDIREEIVGSQYLDLGDSSYVIIPEDVLFEAEIKGQATGTYSITVDTLANNTQTQTFRYIGASTTLVMKATFSFTNSGFTNIKTDINNDGLTDLEQTLNGQVILSPAAYSYPLLKTNIKSLKLSRLLEWALLIQVDAALYWDTMKPAKPAYQKLELAALDSLKATLLVYKQKKYITQTQYTALEVMINNLRK